jgi:NADH dehydrogenase
MNSLFVTGATGFIGSHLLRGIGINKYERVYCLTRSEDKARHLFKGDNLRFVAGSLFDSGGYASSLRSSDVVVHLAAATGKARAQEYFDVNARGTEFLVEQCRHAGVKNFIYISSIAVKFQDKSQYYYAQSKQQGEEAVIRSGLSYTILRPTIVIGKESPAWRSLSALARAPFLFMLGDGATRIQPIYVDDLVEAILSVVDERIFSGETFDLGGPEAIGIEEFLKRIHRLYRGKDPKVVRLGLRPLIPALAFLEKHLYSLLPFTAGQLSAFVNDGTVESNRLFEQKRSRMKNVDSMLGLLAG